ncbi:hypothetical protein VNO80_11000 [Phaseolus coccineus]|uniref:Uncharacterized protein n=1 Tax=Phaseolus coccineus TaxID=3886 RepID=A0AAN9N9M0_PHACN
MQETFEACGAVVRIKAVHLRLVNDCLAPTILERIAESADVTRGLEAVVGLAKVEEVHSGLEGEKIFVLV